MTVNSPGSGTPTGTVTFKDGGSPLGTQTLSGGAVSFTTSSLPSGTHTITAVYGGDANFNVATSNAVTQTVGKSGTTTTLSTSVNPSAVGQPVSMTATISVTSPGSGTPTGTITFKDGANSIGAAAILPGGGGGTATFTTNSLPVGNHTLNVTYNGDANFTGSTAAPVIQTVGQASTTTTVVSSANPSVFGQSVTFSATVVVTSPGVGSPTGTLTFLDGSTTLAVITSGSGTAAFTPSSLTVASHSITVIYSGDTNFGGSTSALLVQTVNQAGTTTTLTSTVNPTVIGQSVTFSATVKVTSPGAGSFTGTVTFMDSSTTLATVALSGGQATFTTGTLPLGTHTVTAFYSGDTNFSTSTSVSLQQTVKQAGTTTTVTSSANPTVFGQPVTFTAVVTITAPGNGTLTGTVTFSDGATSLGTASLTGGSATFATSSFLPGNHTMTAAYGGDTNFAASTSAIKVQTVNKAAVATSVTSSLNP